MNCHVQLFAGLIALLSASAASAATLTNGYINFRALSVDFHMGGTDDAGEGLGLGGYEESYSDRCGYCPIPYALPVPIKSFPIGLGGVYWGDISYSANPMRNSLPTTPWVGPSLITLTPQQPMPIVSTPGIYEVLFDVVATFTLHTPGPVADFFEASTSGVGVARYDVMVVNGTLYFPFPTFNIVAPAAPETVHLPEPATAWAVLLGCVACALAARRRIISV